MGFGVLWGGVLAITVRGVLLVCGFGGSLVAPWVKSSIMRLLLTGGRYC